MKACAYCLEAPGWHYCRNVSYRDKVETFAFRGCRHADAFAKNNQFFVKTTERPAFEAKWDAEAQRLFDVYTTPRFDKDGKCTAWDEPARIHFAASLWPKPAPVIPYELFDRNREEEPTF